MTEHTDALPWARRHWVVVAVVAVVVIVGAWTAWDSHRADDRKDSGYTACEDAVRDQLLPGYDPGISVTFEEKQPGGDLAYSARADDGDGQWTCTVDEDGAVDVADGLVYDS